MGTFSKAEGPFSDVHQTSRWFQIESNWDM